MQWMVLAFELRKHYTIKDYIFLRSDDILLNPDPSK